MTCSFESNLTKPAPPPPASNLKSSKKVGKSKATEGEASCTEVKVEAVPEAASEDGHDSGVASSYEDHHHQTQTNTKAKNPGKCANSGGQASKKQLEGGEKGAKSNHGGKKGKSKQQLKPTRQAAAVTANDFIFDLDE